MNRHKNWRLGKKGKRDIFWWGKLAIGFPNSQIYLLKHPLEIYYFLMGVGEWGDDRSISLLKMVWSEPVTSGVPWEAKSKMEINMQDVYWECSWDQQLWKAKERIWQREKLGCGQSRSQLTSRELWSEDCPSELPLDGSGALAHQSVTGYALSDVKKLSLARIFPKKMDSQWL